MIEEANFYEFRASLFSAKMSEISIITEFLKGFDTSEQRFP